MRRFLVPRSLRIRLIILLLIVSLTPLVLIGYLSYSSMQSILESKAERALQGNLQQVKKSLENTLKQMNHASQQLAFDGEIGKKLDEYLNGSVAQKKQMQDEIKSEISLIAFTNPSVKLIFYYFAGSGEYLFENYRVKDHFELEALPVLAAFGSFTYSGPHLSLNPWDGNQVISILRKVDLPDRDDVYIYIESGFDLTGGIEDNQQTNSDIVHLIIDAKYRILYSEDETMFRPGDNYQSFLNNKAERQNYYLFEQEGQQSWKVVAAIAKSSYEREVTEWVEKFTWFTVLSLALSFLIAWIIWRSVYRPLNHLAWDMKRVSLNNMNSPARSSEIVEFGRIHGAFETMRRKVVRLIAEVEAKEKRKARLEVEKLMHQINPHFLHNTLDTVRWIARTNGQTEIDKFLSTLNKLLHYNLAKGKLARMIEEIEALHSYVTLQEMRYNFRFEVIVDADRQTHEMLIPRFIMQPLVENALYHGMADDGKISVEVMPEGDAYLKISVMDNGDGMTEEEIRALMDYEADTGKKIGFGIGLQYVRRMIHHQFGDEAQFSIRSSPGHGTTISIILPVLREAG